MKLKQFLPLIVTAIAAVFSAPSWADWECSKKETDRPAAQVDLFARATAAMRASLGTPPEGWIMSTPNTRAPSNRLCVDFKNEPTTFGVSVLYSLKPTADHLRTYRNAQIEQRKELDALRALPADVQVKVDAVEAESSRLRKEGREAERAKDRDLAKSKYAEAQDFSRKSSALRYEYELSIQPKEREIYKKYENLSKLNRDTIINVSLEANGNIRATDSGNERITIGTSAKTNQATDKVVRIVASIERNPAATAEQIAIVKGLIDQTKLAALVAGKVPSIEESQVAIAKQNETIALLDTKARDLEKAVAFEGRREEEAAQIAKRQAAEAERAAAKTGKAGDKPADKPAEKSTTTAANTSPTPASTPAPTPASTPTAPPKAPATDTVNQAKDAVNKLKGLFGR
jgi:hypothetical protein